MIKINNQINKLEKKLNYSFKNKNYLIESLVHPSSKQKFSNQRLEFLGDAVLGLILTEWIFKKFTNLNEGELTRIKSKLVKSYTLHEIASNLNLGDYLVVDSQFNIQNTSSISDALEAIIGAMFLDGGFEKIKTIVYSLFEKFINSNLILQADSKTELQEFCQLNKISLPIYNTTEVMGKPPQETFKVQCYVEKYKMITIGEGRNKKIAEQEAAGKMLKLLK